LALEHPKSLLIIDERKGRKIAKTMGLNITGTLGIIIKGKKTGVLEKVKPILDALENANFRISKSLRTAVLKQANEKE
jgi:predicted nucleic acid-binding protein